MVKRIFKNSLIVFFILIFSLFGCHKPKPKKPQVIKEAAATVKSTSQDGVAGKSEDAERFTALINKLDQRSPFTKDHAGIYRLKVASGSLHLGGVLYDGQKPMAIINNQIVGVGDTIEGKQVIKISPDEVILKDKDEERTYKLEVIK